MRLSVCFFCGCVCAYVVADDGLRDARRAWKKLDALPYMNEERAEQLQQHAGVTTVMELLCIFINECSCDQVSFSEWMTFHTYSEYKAVCTLIAWLLMGWEESNII